ncbi:hypothetical protein C8J56DRAFT_789922 [Mycena floridula]|nr:hypothetical protein C8J56DRAFT_789922 [Mycena floridula]
MSSSDSDVLVLVDDPSLSLGGPHWFIEPAGPLLGGTQYIYQNVAPYGSIVYDFSGQSVEKLKRKTDQFSAGTGILFVGNAPELSDAASPKSFNVSIDSNALYVAKFQFPSGINQWYHQFYQSPLLLDGKHSINLSSIVTGVDYAVVTAGQTTPLSGTTILVDDDNPEITYSGSGWQRNTDLIQVGSGYLDAEPVGNATHRSATVGDSFSFQFSGTSVALYGVFDWTEIGKMSVVFTLDGRHTTQDFIAAAGGTAPYQQQNHFLLFEQADLQATNHTVSTTITYADGNRDLIFDYITYVAAFSSLATKPKFTSSLASSSVQSSTATSTSTTSPSPSPAPKKSSGAIIGGSIAAVVIFLIALFAIFFFIRRRRSRNSSPNGRCLFQGYGMKLMI